TASEPAATATRAAPQPEASPSPSPAPTQAAGRCPGAGVEQVIFVSDPNAKAALAHLRQSDYHVYAYSLADPALFRQVQNDPNLKYVQFYGSNRELTLNPAGPIFEGSGGFNPFALPRVREALNWLIDRDYIVGEILGGLGVPKWTPLLSAFPDYARYIDLIRPLERKYAYDPDRAAQVITVEMEKMGAELRDGRWYYDDEPVVLIFVIRTEDERKEIGDYVARQLERVGFTVERVYKTSSEAFALVGGDPHEGKWHLYTAGRLSTIVERDQGYVFELNYTPRARPYPLWQAYQPAEEFEAVAYRLADHDYTTADERRQLFAKALEYALQDSARVWLVDKISFSPMRAEVQVAADLAGGVAGSRLWPYTLRVEPDTGADAVVIAQPDLLTGPWNPLAGSSQIYDLMPLRGTVDWGVLLDPYTGLARPQRVASATVTVAPGTLLQHTLDWVTVEQADGPIPVPGDAWADWDPATGQFVTAAERFPEGATARARIVVEYPADLFQTVRWHDGSPLSVADFVMTMILRLAPGKEGSPIYERALAGRVEGLLSTLKGVRIVSTDPLVIETYTDALSLDAENLVAWEGTWFPTLRLGPAAWHVAGLGVRAVAAGDAAFTRSQADQNDVEWLNYLDGPALDILARHLEQAAAEGYIPFPALEPYLSADEVATRWANYRAWYARYGHFWVGSGPFMLTQVHGVEDNLVLECAPTFPDPVDKWAALSEPLWPEVHIDGPTRVSAAEGGAWTVFVETRDGEPYPKAEVDQVRYFFWLGADLLAQGRAVADEPGRYTVTAAPRLFPADSAQPVTLEVVVTVRSVSKPTLVQYEFMVTP
ncbi:MAG: ABC transporter substrate-binding protein, partial [Chloroflexi bacterium]|nr:ABC transporter substrate-binding protein [Chloroflexota bacterium]